MNTAVQQPNDRANTTPSLRKMIHQAIAGYLSELGDQNHANLYDLVLAEIEDPLISEVLKFTHGNQSKTARLLGISRGTLRKKTQTIRYDLKLWWHRIYDQ